MTALSSTDLAALEKLCEAAPGDVWSSGNRSDRMGTSPDGRYDIFEGGDYLLFPDKGPGPVAIAAGESNAAAIVALFNAFPSLAATIRADKARIGELESGEDFKRWQAVCDASKERDEAISERDAARAEIQQLKTDLANQTFLRERNSEELSVTRRNWRNDLRTIDQLSENGNAWRKRIGELEKEVERLRDRRNYWENNFWNERKCAIAARKQRDEAIAEVAKLSGAAS